MRHECFSLSVFFPKKIKRNARYQTSVMMACVGESTRECVFLRVVSKCVCMKGGERVCDGNKWCVTKAKAMGGVFWKAIGGALRKAMRSVCM